MLDAVARQGLKTDLLDELGEAQSRACMSAGKALISRSTTALSVWKAQRIGGTIAKKR